MTDHHPTPRPPVRRAVRAFVLTVLLVAPLGLALPAVAHPFGPPLQVELEGVAHDVNLRWTAAEDDWLALARHVGAFDEVPEQDDGTQLSGAERIARADGVEDYVLDHVAVTQHGHACTGEVVHLADDLVTEGVIVQFTCEEQVHEVDVAVDLLTDVHAAYRTVATSRSGGTPGEALYTATDTQHTWDFGAVAQPTTSRTPVGAIAGVAVLVVAAGALVWLGLRSRPPAGPDERSATAAPASAARADAVPGTTERAPVGPGSAI